MNKFIKNFDTFIKEDLDTEQLPDELPQEVQSSVKSILDGNFDQAWRKRFVGDTIRFRVTDTDFKLEPQLFLSVLGNSQRGSIHCRSRILGTRNGIRMKSGIKTGGNIMRHHSR